MVNLNVLQVKAIETLDLLDINEYLCCDKPNIFSNVMIIYLIRNSSEKKTIKLMSFSDSQVLLKAFKFSVYQTF